MVKKALLVAALALPLLAQAQVVVQDFVPESGFYWNQSQSGRGYSIEVQDRYLFMVAYLYDEAGNPLWLIGQGPLSQIAGRYEVSGTLQRADDGQCLGCPVGEPVYSDTSIAFALSFDSPTSANLTLGSETIAVQRFWYSPSIAQAELALMGQWTIVMDRSATDASAQPFEGDMLDIYDLVETSGETFSEGYRSATAIPVSAAYDAQEDFYLIVVGESSEEFLAYYFSGSSFGTRSFAGQAERYVPGTALTGAGAPAYGQRISDRSFAMSAFGAKQARAPLSAARSPDTARPVDVAVLNALARRVEAMLAKP